MADRDARVFADCPKSAPSAQNWCIRTADCSMSACWSESAVSLPMRFIVTPGGSTGYAGSAVVARNCSAVTAACLMTRRAVFDELGGFDEELPVDFNDVDFCLRLRAAGYRIVFTPYAELIHHESASFGSRMQSSAESARMRERWGAALERDPYYNPNLSKLFSDYRLQL